MQITVLSILISDVKDAFLIKEFFQTQFKKMLEECSLNLPTEHSLPSRIKCVP